MSCVITGYSQLKCLRYITGINFWTFYCLVLVFANKDACRLLRSRSIKSVVCIIFSKDMRLGLKSNDCVNVTMSWLKLHAKVSDLGPVPRWGWQPDWYYTSTDRYQQDKGREDGWRRRWRRRRWGGGRGVLEEVATQTRGEVAPMQQGVARECMW